jgi:prevent-host-death family protein
MTTLNPMKRVTVAEARSSLATLLDEAQASPVEIVRRGKQAAVLLSRSSYDRLRRIRTRSRKSSTRLWAAIERFRATHDLAELDAASALEGVRDRSTTGRAVRW